jgi:fibronectin type III domain protein
VTKKNRAWCSLILTMFVSLLTGCGGGGSGDPAVSSFSTPTGAAVSLAWDPVQDPTVYAYYVHYGRQSTGQQGSCNYSDSIYVSSPSATVVGLDPDTRYYFSVSAYNGVNGACSNEVSTVTPSAQG